MEDFREDLDDSFQHQARCGRRAASLQTGISSSLRPQKFLHLLLKVQPLLGQVHHYVKSGFYRQFLLLTSQENAPADELKSHTLEVQKVNRPEKGQMFTKNCLTERQYLVLQTFLRVF